MPNALNSVKVSTKEIYLLLWLFKLFWRQTLLNMTVRVLTIDPKVELFCLSVVSGDGGTVSAAGSVAQL